MNRDEQEMALWREAWLLGMEEMTDYDGAAEAADAAVAAFRKRYPPQPAAPEAVWYDEPPLPKDGTMLTCWIEGYRLPGFAFWNGEEWRMYVAGDRYADPLAGRRVCPIVKPPEPTP